MIIVGGLTRLTDSGLSITAWELFSGLLPPMNIDKWNFYFSAYKKIPEYKLVNFDMTLNEFKTIFYWEYSHRLLARVVGIISIIPIIYFTFKFKRPPFYLKKYYFIFFLICIQGFLGWFMVTSGLVENTDVSHFRLALHLTLALIILMVILWDIFELYNLDKFIIKISTPFLFFLFLLLLFQIILGAFLAGLDGGLIYNTWPDMNGVFLPNEIIVYDFLKLDSFSNPSIVQFYHRIIGYRIIIFTLILNYLFLKEKIEFRYIMIFNSAITFQVILGIFTLITGVEIKYASLHQIGSIFVLSSYLLIVYKNSN
jgi:cytochrome c oxidase assembly protein subunit 15